MKTQIKSLKKPLDNERGMATIETIPLILVFVFMMAYEIGMFGVIHTGIMNSISARTYAFETFRNRSNLVYFRDIQPPANHYREVGNRTHAVRSEADLQTDTMGIATERPIRVGIPMEIDSASRNNQAVHNEKVFDQKLVGNQQRNTTVSVNPVWLQVQYGICMNSRCER